MFKIMMLNEYCTSLLYKSGIYDDYGASKYKCDLCVEIRMEDYFISHNYKNKILN